MRMMPQKTAMFLLSGAILLSPGCTNHFTGMRPISSSAYSEKQERHWAWADNPVGKARETLLLDPKIARMEGIERLMESTAGKCALYDLARMGDGGHMRREARRIFTLLSGAERLFLDEFSRLESDGEIAGRASRLEIACLAFWHAMEWNFVKPEPGVGFATGLGAWLPRADCDVSAIMFIDFARQVGLDLVGLRVTFPEPDKNGHFLAAARAEGKIRFHIETTFLLGSEEGVDVRLSAIRNHAIMPPGKWKDARKETHKGAKCAYLDQEGIVKTCTVGPAEGFSQFAF